ncbi:hypothetical protein VPH35_061551 [Triticum aestivum]
MASMMEEASSFWCHACSRLHQTRAGKAMVTCLVCAAAPSASLESIVDVLDARTFLNGCHPAGRPASAHAERLSLVTVVAAGLACPICLDELDSGASAAETPCKHVYHPTCLAPWLEARDTCSVCRAKPVPEDDADVSLDGLILWDQRNGRSALGRRTAGRVRMVGVLDEDGMLMRHCSPLPYVKCSLGVLRGLHWVRHCAARLGSRLREPRREIV